MSFPSLNSYLKSFPFNSVCKTNAYLPPHTQNSESGDSKQIFKDGLVFLTSLHCIFSGLGLPQTLEFNFSLHFQRFFFLILQKSVARNV